MDELTGPSDSNSHEHCRRGKVGPAIFGPRPASAMPGLLGIFIYIVLENFFHLEIAQLLSAVLIPIVLFNLLFARHSKSLFIAMDHLYDPHEKDPGDDGGNLPYPTPPTKGSGGPAAPIPPLLEGNPSQELVHNE